MMTYDFEVGEALVRKFARTAAPVFHNNKWTYNINAPYIPTEHEIYNMGITLLDSVIDELREGKKHAWAESGRIRLGATTYNGGRTVFYQIYLSIT